MLARTFAAYLHGAITSVELRRIAHAMNSAFTDDLRQLLAWDESIHDSYGSDWKEPLVGSGFTRVRTEHPYDGGAVYYELTDLGRTLRRAMHHVEALSSSA